VVREGVDVLLVTIKEADPPSAVNAPMEHLFDERQESPGDTKYYRFAVDRRMLQEASSKMKDYADQFSDSQEVNINDFDNATLNTLVEILSDKQLFMSHPRALLRRRSTFQCLNLLHFSRRFDIDWLIKALVDELESKHRTLGPRTIDVLNQQIANQCGEGDGEGTDKAAGPLRLTCRLPRHQ